MRPEPISCDVANIADTVNRIDEVCCVPASVCASGAPEECNSQCAHVFLTFYNKCYSEMSDLIKGQLGVFDVLAAKCDLIAPEPSCLTKDHQKQVRQYLKSAKKTEDKEQRDIFLDRIRTVLGLAGEEEDDPASHCLPMVADLPLLADTEDDSANGHAASTHGDAYIADGAHFDGSGDYLTVASFDYASDGQFSIGEWFTKESCTGGIYEYLYSHADRTVRAKAWICTLIIKA